MLIDEKNIIDNFLCDYIRIDGMLREVVHVLDIIEYKYQYDKPEAVESIYEIRCISKLIKMVQEEIKNKNNELDVYLMEKVKEDKER